MTVILWGVFCLFLLFVYFLVFNILLNIRSAIFLLTLFFDFSDFSTTVDYALFKGVLEQTWPIYMLIIYEPDKTDKNTLDFLIVNITIKMILHLVSLTKKSKFWKTCSKCASQCWWHTWSRWAKLLITLTHTSLVMLWIWVIGTLSSPIVRGLFWYPWSFKKPQR